MAKRVTISKEDVELIAKGADLVVKLSPKRSIVIGTKTIKDVKAEALTARYEADLAKLATEDKDVVE